MEAFIEDVNTRTGRFKKRLNKHDYTTQTEEATKTAFVLPFIEMLGYDTRDLDDVVPEYTADFGLKKGEKVDYALLHEGEPAILVECKSYGTPLEGAPISQIARYFAVTPAQFAILTDGIDYQFYTSHDNDNVMDMTPSFTFSMLEHTEQDVQTLYTYHKDVFNAKEAMGVALCARRRNDLASSIRSLLENPTEDFIAFLVRTVYTDGVLTRRVREEFTPIVRDVCRAVVEDEVERRLNEAISAMPKAAAQEDGVHLEDPSEEIVVKDQRGGKKPSAKGLQAYEMLRNGATTKEVTLSLGVKTHSVQAMVSRAYFPESPLKLVAIDWDEEGDATNYKWVGYINHSE